MWLGPQGPPLVLIGGKGGVGKTTVACAVALRMAAECSEQYVLLASTDPAHSLGDALGHPIGPAPVRLPVPGNLFAQEVAANTLLAEFLERHGPAMRTLICRGTYLDEHDVTPFLGLSLPGLDEMMAVLALARELVEARFQRIVIDTAPTGHTLRLLELPAVLARWVRYLDDLQAKHRYLAHVYGVRKPATSEEEFLADLTHQISSLRSLLTDSNRCRFVTVTLCEPMVLAETEDLLEALKRLHIASGPVVINCHESRSCCPAGTARVKTQSTALSAHPAVLGAEHSIFIPRFPHEIRGEDALAQLAAYLDAEPAPLVSATPTRFAWPLRRPSSTPMALDALPALPASTRMLLFGGKGGVGKTTLASVFAIHAVRHDPVRRVLLFSTDPAHSLSDFFGQPVGDEPAACSRVEGLWLQAIDPVEAWKKAKGIYRAEIGRLLGSLNKHAGVDLPFDRAALATIFDLSPPGIDEMMALSCLADHLDSGAYDLVILDTAPSGHTLRFLELPGLAIEWLRNFFALLLRYKNALRLGGVSRDLVALSKKLHRVRDVLRDGAASSFVTVTIPTHLALEETARLLASLSALGVRCHGIVVNHVPSHTECTDCQPRTDAALAVLAELRTRFKAFAQVHIPEFGAPISLDSDPEVMELLSARLGQDSLRPRQARSGNESA